MWFAASAGASALGTFKPAALESVCRASYKTGIPSALTASTEALCLVSARVVRSQIVSPIIDDGIDGHDLYLARVVKGHRFSLGVAFKHFHDSGRRIRSSFGGVVTRLGMGWGPRCKGGTENVLATGMRGQGLLKGQYL